MLFLMMMTMTTVDSGSDDEDFMPICLYSTLTNF